MGHTIQVAERHYSTHGVPQRALEALQSKNEKLHKDCIGEVSRENQAEKYPKPRCDLGIW